MWRNIYSSVRYSTWYREYTPVHVTVPGTENILQCMLQYLIQRIYSSACYSTWYREYSPVCVTVPGTENVLVERTLATLTLSPETREALLQRPQVEDLQNTSDSVS